MTFEELFWKALPQYLAIGMSAEEFWHGPFDLARAYREAWLIRRDNAYMAEWRQGVYFQEALSVALSNAFVKGSSATYPEEPLFTASEERRRAREAARERARMEQNKIRLQGIAKRLNERLARKSEEAGGRPSGEVPSRE